MLTHRKKGAKNLRQPRNLHLKMDKKDLAIAVLSILLILSVASSLVTYHYQQQIIEKQLQIIRELSTGGGGATDTGTGNSGVSVPPTPAIPAKPTQVPRSSLPSPSPSPTPTPTPILTPTPTFPRTPTPMPPLAIPASTGTFTPKERSASANIVAVRSDTNEGVIGKVRVEIKNGEGRVLANTKPFVEPDTQYSVRTAVKVATKYTHSDMNSMDFIVSFDINGTLIGGPSAGAAITAATIAALEGKKVREDVAITGTIEEDGSIGRVGAVFEKAVAAEKNGIRLFLVPKGQRVVTFWERKEVRRQIGPFSFIQVYYEPKRIDLAEYMRGKMDVREVSTIDDVVKYMIY